MLEPTRPALIVSDLHLSRSDSSSAGDLAVLLGRYPGRELVVVGDLFELAMDPRERHANESMAALLKGQPTLVAALRKHLQGGVPVTVLAGNHDAPVAERSARDMFLDILGLSQDAPLSNVPWFIRRGNAHIEHGHLYDPDNAPNHPLSLWNYDTEPLGIALTRRFVSPHGATMFAHAYETTPLSGLLGVLKSFRGRAPLIISSYFHTAWGLCLRAYVKRAEILLERERGERGLPDLALETGMGLHTLNSLLESSPRPTHQRFSDTFMRLYFDRIIAGAVTGVAASVGAISGGPAWLVAAAGASYLAYSVKGSGSRYSNLPVQRLRTAAETLRTCTGAEHVVFGHTHVEDDAPGYMNSGTFAFARDGARPYLLLEDGRLTRQRFACA